MSYSTLGFSATLPPFYYTSGYNTNFSNSSLTTTGDVSIATTKDGETGQNQTTISSSLLSNGVSYTQNDASINGNRLTVNYLSSNTDNLPSANINGNGVYFAPQSSITSARAVTTAYSSVANGNFGLAIKGSALSSGSSDSGQHIVLKSLAVVGNVITATYELTSNLQNNTVLASPNAPVVDSPTITVSNPAPVHNNMGATFSTKGVMTIGDVLAATNGLSANGTISGALQPVGQGPATGFPDPKAILAATLNPSANATPDQAFHVTNFINTSLNAFPTSNPNVDAFNAYKNASDSFNSSSSDNPFSSATSNSFINQSSGSGYNASMQTSIYNAVGSASTSTIRGTGYSGTA